MRFRRSVKIGLGVLGGVVAACCLLAGLTITVLKTGWGGERLRRFAVTRANAQIQGHLDIGRLSFGGASLVVEDVQLRDPDGHFVGSVARAEVALAPLRVLHKELRVTGVSIVTPVVDLASGPAGSNLARAIQPRHPSPSRPAQPKTSKEGWVVRLDRFDLTGGAITVSTSANTPASTKLHVTDLGLHATARYATGNGNLDLNLRLEGQSVQAPTGPLHLAADAHVRGQEVQLSADGVLLGGTVLARAKVDGQHLAAAQGRLAIDIPAVLLAGNSWGPLRVDGTAEPGTVPRLTLALDVPGVTVRGKGGPAEAGPADAGRGALQGVPSDRFDFTAHVNAADLGQTASAVQALASTALSPLGGRGTVDLKVGGPMSGAPASWSAALTVDVPRLTAGDTAVNGLALKAQAAHLSRDPRDATLVLAVAGIRAGTTNLRGVDVSSNWREKEITLAAKLASPQPITLALGARMDDSYQALSLTRLDLTFPGGEWALDSAARVGFGGDTLSLDAFSLSSRGQTLAVDARKEGQSISAHVDLEHLRLEALPALLVDPTLHLAGELGVDVKAAGAISNPRVTAAVRLQHGRVRGFSRLDVKADATLANRHVDGTVAVDAPFTAARTHFALPTDVAERPDAPMDVRLDVQRLDLGEALHASGSPARADGRLTAQLHASGSLARPQVEATITGKELQVLPEAKPPVATKRITKQQGEVPDAIDLGHARLRVTYADQQAKADLDFASSHGGTLRVDAAAHLDLSYPRVTEGINVKKLPVRGKVAAKELDVAWLAQLSDRVQSMAGRVDADAKLSGTVADPQFIGDVRWKNGKIIANTAPDAPAAGERANAPAAAPRARRSGH